MATRTIETSEASGARASGATRRLFFYGILRNPAHHAGLPLRRVGMATVQGDLYSVGSAFPALVDGDGVVHGEVYEAPDSSVLRDALQLFDAIEGYRTDDPAGSMYLRHARRTADGQLVWVYVWNGSMRYLTPIESGDWLAR